MQYAEFASNRFVITRSVEHCVAGHRITKQQRDRVRKSFAARCCLSFLVLITLLGLANPAWGQANQKETDSLLQHAKVEEDAGRYASAESIYQRALEITPSDPEILKRLGIVQQTEMKFDESIQNFRRVLAQDPSSPQANFFLGVSYLGNNDFSAAIDSFHNELHTSKPHPRSRYYLALALQSAGRTDEAISELNQSVKDNPKDADSLYQLARIYKNASFQTMERLKAVDPDSFQVHALMGEVYADELHYNDAIKEYQAALSKRPDAPGIHYAIGIAYWAQNQLDPAEKEFTDALRENAEDALTNLYLGDIAVHRQRFPEALTFLKIAEKGQPRMAQVHILLGKCYQGQGDLEKARAEFLAATQYDPTAAQPHYLLSQVYRKLNQPESSANELAQFQALSKDAPKGP